MRRLAKTLCLMRPLATLCHRINSLAAELQAVPRAVSSGGRRCAGQAAGELTLAIHKRLGHQVGFHLTLLQGKRSPSPAVPRQGGPPISSKRLRGSAASPSGSPPGSSVSKPALCCSTAASRVTIDAVLWATNAASRLRYCGPQSETRRQRLPDSSRHLYRLRSGGSSAPGTALASPLTWTCRRTEFTPSERERLLFDNLTAFLREQPLRRFRPQWFCLSISTPPTARPS